MRIGLLLCDKHDEQRPVPLRFQKLFHEYADLDWVTFDALSGELPEAVDACDGYLITGSPYNPNDQAAWIDNLRDFVIRVHHARCRTVGVCFGHQLIAQALGGQVEIASGWGAALKEIEIIQHTLWMEPPQAKIRLVAIHRSQVTRLPSCAMLLGRSDYCLNALFQVDNHMIGIQMHPEIDPSFGREIVMNGRDVIQSPDYERDIASFSEQDDSAIFARWLVNFWTGTFGA